MNKIMTYLRLAIPVSIVFMFLIVPHAVHGETVTLTSGSITIGGAFPPGRGTFRTISFSFAGDGFSANGGDPDGSRQTVNSDCVFTPCSAGTSISYNSEVLLQQNLPGSAMILGLGSFSNNAFFYGSLFSFQGLDLVVPTGSSQIVTLQAPFEVNGTLVIQGGEPSAEIFSTTIIGSGTALVTLQQFLGGYVITTIRYEFESTPVPEPAAIFILATGLGSASFLRKRKRESSQG